MDVNEFSSMCGLRQAVWGFQSTRTQDNSYFANSYELIGTPCGTDKQDIRLGAFPYGPTRASCSLLFLVVFCWVPMGPL